VQAGMKITITEAAAAKLAEKLEGKQGYVKLKYDIDGCGCAVNGVAVLWLENELDETETEISTNGIKMYIEKSKEVFFADEMTIDYSQTSGCYQLKSPNEYLNPRMSFFDKTEVSRKG
jgi:uncharacterized protein YqkB